MKAITTLNKIRSHSPCSSGWTKLLAGLGKTKADDEPLSLEQILEINGIDDAIWAIRAVEGPERSARLFACDCAESVLPRFENCYPDDKRPRTAIEVARRFAHGEATVEELRVAAYADAADAAAYADAAARAAAAAAYAARAAAAAYYAAYAADAAYYAARAAAADAWETQIELFRKHFCTE